MEARRRSLPDSKNAPLEKTAKIAAKTAICLLLCGGTFLVKQFYPQGAETMNQVLLGSTDGAYEEAFANFGKAVYEGDEVQDAFLQLCTLVFQGDGDDTASGGE